MPKFVHLNKIVQRPGEPPGQATASSSLAMLQLVRQHPEDGKIAVRGVPQLELLAHIVGPIEPEHGGVREPASWRLLFKDGDSWRPIPNPSGYGTALNQYNEVTFDPVRTTELKIEIQFQPGRCGSLIRWRVE